MDALDILCGKADFTFTGKYFERLPHETKATADGTFDLYAANLGGEVFDYEYASTVDKEVRVLFSRVEAVADTTTIRTNADLPFKPHAYVLLEDGKLYTIEAVATDRSKQKGAARFGFMPLAPDKVLQLVERENPWL